MTRRQRILLVDDDQDLIGSVQAFLGARGYAVDTAFNGPSAEARIAAQRPDLIVCDVMMDHDSEGFDLAFRLKRRPELRPVPIILLTGFLQHLEEKLTSFVSITEEPWPAARMLEKPVNLKDLAAHVLALIGPAELPEDAAEPQD